METSSTKVGISDRKLRKSLNTWDLLFLSLGGIIGSGWLFAAFAASGLAGPASILSWIIGGVIVLIISLNYAELGAMIPRSGSIVRYGQFSHGNFAGYFLAWAYFLSAVSVPAIEAEAVVGYASAYYPTLYNGAVLSATGIVFAGLLMVLFFFLNYFGIKVMGKTNTGMTWWKLVLPIATIVILMAVHFSVANFTTRLATSGSAFMPYGFAPVLAAVATSGIVFSFLGFRQGLDYAGEAKTPQKSVPIATVFSVLIGIAIYVLLQVAFIGAINWHTLGVPVGSWSSFIPGTGIANGGFATAAVQGLYDAPFATLASSAGLVGLSYVLFADAYVSPSGTLSVYLGTSMRTLFGIGMLKFLPKSLTKVNDKYRIPVLPLFVSLILGFVFFAPFPSWYKLVGFITGATVFTYIVGGPSLRVLRKHAPELQRPFKLPGSEILAPLAFIGASLVVYWSMWPTVGYLAIAIALGLIVYAIFYLGGGKANGMVSLFSREHLISGMWVPVYVIVLSVESYIGESTLGGANYVPYPYDMIMVVLVAIVFYFWSIYSGIKTEEIKTMIDSDSQYVIPEEFGKEGMQEAP